jgi:hypothetical protein
VAYSAASSIKCLGCVHPGAIYFRPGSAPSNISRSLAPDCMVILPWVEGPEPVAQRRQRGLSGGCYAGLQ